MLSREEGRDARTLLIAANPDAGWFLHQKGITFTPLDDYHRNRSPGEIEALLKKQLRWAEATDRLLQESIPQFQAANFQPTRYYLYYLKNSWDSYIHRAEILEHLADQCHPEEISYWSDPGAMQFDTNLTPQGSVLSACIPHWAKRHGIHEYPHLAGDRFWEIQDDSTTPMKRLVFKLISQVPPHLDSLISLFRKGAIAVMRTGSGEKAAGRPIIVIREHYDVTGELCDHLRLAGFDLVPFYALLAEVQRGLEDGGLFPDLLACAWETASSEGWFWEPKGWQDWSLRALLEPLFRHYWFTVIPEIWRFALAAGSVFKRTCPGAVVTGIINGPYETGMIMAARSSGIPVIFYSHGASMGDIENLVWDLTDRIYGDYMLVYGPGPAAYTQSRPPLVGPVATPVPVGSARLDALRQNQDLPRIRRIRQRIAGDPAKPIVLYVPGVLFTNYFRYDHYNFRPFRFFQVRKAVAELLQEHQGAQFVYKAFISSGRDPSLEMLRQVCPKCRIVGDIPLSQLQWASDLLIHEIPSTGMYEGLITDRPLIVYADRDIFSMDPWAAKLLSRRASVAQNQDEFIRLIESALEKGGSFQVPDQDRSFLKEYCTHLDDGASARRAADEICQIAQRRGVSSGATERPMKRGS